MNKPHLYGCAMDSCAHNGSDKNMRDVVTVLTVAEGVIGVQGKGVRERESIPLRIHYHYAEESSSHTLKVLSRLA